MERNAGAGVDGVGPAADDDLGSIPVAAPRVVGVHVGRTVDAEWAGTLKRTAIEKRAVDGRVAVGRLGLSGDEHANTESHGGLDQAVYVYAREDLDWWAAQLGRQLRDGMFGENLTVRGVDVSAARLGERWRVGTSLLELTAARIPCVVFRGWMDEQGWVRRFTEAGRPGAYARVLEEGTVAAGDPIEVVQRPTSSVTVAEAVRAYHGDIELLRRLLALPGLSDKWRAIAERILGERNPLG